MHYYIHIAGTEQAVGDEHTSKSATKKLTKSTQDSASDRSDSRINVAANTGSQFFGKNEVIMYIFSYR